MSLDGTRRVIIHDKDGRPLASSSSAPTGNENAIIVRTIDAAYDPVEGVLKVANLVWDVDTLSWIRQTPSTGGGGGGDASAANQVTGNNLLADISGKLPAVQIGDTPPALPKALLVQETTVAPSTKLFTYDVDGNLETIEITMANGSKKVRKTFSWDVDGNLESVTEAVLDV